MTGIPEQPQPVADVYLQIAGHEEWILISQYGDRSGITGCFGPFNDEQSALDAKAPLLEAGIDGALWQALPLKKVITEP